MLQNYLEKNIITLEDLKDYLFYVDVNYSMKIEKFFSKKQLQQHVKENYLYYLNLSFHSLMKVKLNQLENHLVIMNYLYGEDPRFDEYKVMIKKLVLAFYRPLEAYRILRHVMKLTRLELIDCMKQAKYLSDEDIAYIYMIEGYTKNAYHVLKNIEENESLVNLYASYDIIGAYQLMHHYKHPKGERLCLTSMKSYNQYKIVK